MPYVKRRQWLDRVLERDSLRQEVEPRKLIECKKRLVVSMPKIFN